MEVTLHNTTQKLCVIGDPVLHSKSPLIQNTMLRALGLDYIYLCQPVPRGRAGEWLKCAAFAGYAGFNATMPHKEELLPLMDELDEDARMYGAVNTVCIRDGKYYGFNTDGKGFLASLRHAGVNTAGQRVLVLGAGGAAKAVAPKLCQEGAARAVYVANRTAEKAQALCAPWGERMIPADFRPETLAELAAQCSLVVNCTNLGMEGTAPFWTPCQPERRCATSSMPPPRPSFSGRRGCGASQPSMAWACSSGRRSSPWSTSPAPPSTGRPCSPWWRRR